MKKISKNLMLFIIMAILCFAFAITANAETVTGECGIEGDNLIWTFDTETGVLLIDGEGEMDNYEYYANNRPWESFVDSIKTVIIENGVTSIGNSVFYCNYNLTNVTIPDSITIIGDYAFYNCSSIIDVSISDNVTTIGDRAFSYCYGIKNIYISEKVTTIGISPFSGCKNITSITVDSNNPYYSNDEYGVLFNKDKTKLIQYPTANIRTRYVIPESVTDIGNYAFADSYNLISVTIPDSVKNFGLEVFWYCKNLKNITIPDSATIINRGMFYHCESLTSVTIPDSVTTIVNDAFNYCENLKDVYYSGTEEEWNSIIIYKNNDPLFNAKIHYSHTHNYKKNITHSTCTEKGYTTFTCECGDSYVADYVDAYGHDLTDWVNNEANGTATRECNNCDYSETVPITNQGECDIEIEAPEQPDCDFDVEEPKKDSDTYILAQQVVADNTGDNTEVLKVFDITLKNSDGVHVQPNGSVKVKLPLNWEKDGNYKVYRVNDDGTLTDMNAYRQGSHMVFDTDHFSIYAIVEETPEKEKGSFFDFLKNIFNWFKDIIQKIADVFRSLCDYT